MKYVKLTILRVDEFIPIALVDMSTLSPLDHLNVNEGCNHSGTSADISQVNIASFPISISKVLGDTITSNFVITRSQMEVLI